MNRMPVIDYEAHPAFVRHVVGRGSDSKAEAMIADIEISYAKLCVSNDRSAEALEASYDRDVAPKIDALLDHLLTNRARPEFKFFLTSAFGVARRVMREDLASRHSFSPQRNSGAETLKGHFQSGLAFIRQNGFYKFRNALLAKLIWLATPFERAILQAKKRALSARHCVLPIEPYSPAGWMIRHTLKANGMIDFVSAYLGKEMEFCYAALDHAHPAQNWYQDCYQDAGLPTSKTVYMHIDADCDIIKAMFYLHDVGEKDGPFRFIGGSHQWQRSPLTVAVQKGFDEASREVFAGTSQHYYRPRFSQPEHRQDLLSLPPQIRGSTHFGDDILDGSDLSGALLQAEHSFTSPAGTIIIFDGSRGIHRGGQVQPGGRRWAIQLAFRVRPDQILTRRKKLRRFLGGHYDYLRFVARNLAALMAGK